MTVTDRRLRLAPGAAAHDQSGEALRALAIALAPYLRAVLGVGVEATELIDVCKTVPGPRRVLARACREGAIAGAARVGRRWLATRAAVDDYLRARGPRNVTPHSSAGDDPDDLEDLRRELTRGGKR